MTKEYTLHGITCPKCNGRYISVTMVEQVYTPPKKTMDDWAKEKESTVKLSSPIIIGKTETAICGECQYTVVKTTDYTTTTLQWFGDKKFLNPDPRFWQICQVPLGDSCSWPQSRPYVLPIDSGRSSTGRILYSGRLMYSCDVQ